VTDHHHPIVVVIRRHPTANRRVSSTLPFPSQAQRISTAVSSRLDYCRAVVGVVAVVVVNVLANTAQTGFRVIIRFAF
jgi:hypothetical protein